MVCKLIILVRKRKGISDEEFHAYWSENHPRVFLKNPRVQEKVLSYTQYHAHKAELAGFKSLPTVSKGTQWDGIVNITVEKVEDLAEIFEDEDYLKPVADDEAKFLDREDALMMLGHDEDKKINGQVLPGVL